MTRRTRKTLSTVAWLSAAIGALFGVEPTAVAQDGLTGDAHSPATVLSAPARHDLARVPVVHACFQVDAAGG